MTEQAAQAGRSPLQEAGLTDLEAEHALQYKLLVEVERLLAAGNLAAAGEVARQLSGYSEAHFGSEEVLMRLHSYPGYQSHLREHGDLLNALRLLIAAIDSDSSAMSAGAIRQWLSAHVHHADQAFVDFIRGSGGQAQPA